MIPMSPLTQFWSTLEAKGGGGGAQTVTSVVNVPPKSAEETELDQLNLSIAKQQQQQLLRAQALQDPTTALAEIQARGKDSQYSGLFAGDDPTILNNQLNEQLASNTQNKELNDLIMKQLVGRISGKAFLSPEEQSALDTLYGSAAAQGNADLERFGGELANQRGGRRGDSGIGGELLRQKQLLETGLQGAKAASTLDLTQGQRNFEESVREFQAGLANTGFQNRLSLASSVPSVSLNLAGNLAAQRFQGISRTQTNSNVSPSFSQLVGGIGAAAAGIGGAAAGFGFGRSNGTRP